MTVAVSGPVEHWARLPSEAQIHPYVAPAAIVDADDGIAAEGHVSE